jgi:hypothetical protein
LQQALPQDADIERAARQIRTLRKNALLIVRFTEKSSLLLRRKQDLRRNSKTQQQLAGKIS